MSAESLHSLEKTLSFSASKSFAVCGPNRSFSSGFFFTSQLLDKLCGTNGPTGTSYVLPLFETDATVVTYVHLLSLYAIKTDPAGHWESPPVAFQEEFL